LIVNVKHKNPNHRTKLVQLTGLNISFSALFEARFEPIQRVLYHSRTLILKQK